jgi:hypothetical protein
MTADGPQTIEELVRSSGEQWLLDWYAPKEQAVPRLLALLQSADQRLQERMPAAGCRLDEQTLLSEFRKSPHKVRAFLQAAGETDSADMLLLAWRLLQGAEIVDVKLNYRLKETFSMRVVIRMADDPEEHYESHDIDDAAVLRHLGILKMGNLPVFDGFFSLNR